MMNLKSNKASALALALVPALAVVVLWLGMGQLSLSAVEIQDEAVQATTAVTDTADAVPTLKSWEYTRGPLIPLDPILATRTQRPPAS